MGEKVVHQLGRAGIWVGGYSCSVKRFVAVQPRRKEAWWMHVMDGIKSHVEFVMDRLGKKKTRGRRRRRGKGRVLLLGRGI